MGNFGVAKSAGIVFVLCVASAVPSTAQTFTSLLSFDSTDGANPGIGYLTQATDGNFYGTTINGGTKNFGSIYKVTPQGALTSLYSFCQQTNCDDGKFPYGVLVQGADGNFYGTTNAGGAQGLGTIFKISSTGTFSVVYSFCSVTSCADGQGPYAGLVLATDGNFYGATTSTIFKLTAAGIVTTLYTFCTPTSCSSGADPQGALIQATNGNLYGTAITGGTYSCGTIFEMTTAGKFTTLHSFNNTDGCMPGASLIQASNGNFYGTTSSGGANNKGTLFKITSSGTFTKLYDFCSQTNCADGGYLHSGLTQGTDGNFYGTAAGGTTTDGVIYEFTSANKMITLYTFSGPDGNVPYAGLLQGTDGTFYGTTLDGGINNYGTIFNLANGLSAFVKPTTTSGKVGASVVILGTNLTGASSVTFAGTSATFTVVSGSEITTTVPAGAVTGTINVTVNGSTLKSNATFRVTPQILTFSPGSGAAGAAVTINGVSLTKTTKVSFGGVAATSFTVNSDTQVTATVPTGAKTGKIQITTTGGTASSATNFTVTP